MSTADGDLGGSTALLAWTPRLTVRARLTLSYAGLLVAAGVATAVTIYLVMRYVPNYPLTAANPQDIGPVASRGEILSVLVRASGVALSALTLIGIGGGWLIAGRMLRPLQEITAAANLAATTGSLDHRVGLTGRHDEFTDLSETFDAMLDRLQMSFQEHRRFAANASHELRTPYATTKTMLEVALADPDGHDLRDLVRRLLEVNQRGIDISEVLLALAGISNRPIDTHPVDLAETVRSAVETLSGEARAARITLSTDLATCTVHGNEALVHQLVVNLVQNGIRHNLGAHGTVMVSTHVDQTSPGRVLLEVRNTGAPIPPEQVRTMLEPFTRGGGRLAGPAGRPRGHGLGLTMVSRIVEVHQGTLDLSANLSGGLSARVFLPAPPPPRARPAIAPLKADL